MPVGNACAGGILTNSLDANFWLGKFSFINPRLTLGIGPIAKALVNIIPYPFQFGVLPLNSSTNSWAGQVTTGPKGSIPSVPGLSKIALFTVAALALAACAGNTPEQQAAEMRALALGIACLAATTTKVAAVAATPTPDAIKVADAAAAVGSEFAVDPACGAPALTNR